MNSQVVQEDVSQENWDVKCISGVKKENGGICFKVHWGPTWVREDHVVGCEHLIEIFADSQKDGLYVYTVNKNGTRCDSPPVPP